MNTHDVRFVWLKVQSDTEWNSHGNIPTYGDYFWTAMIVLENQINAMRSMRLSHK